MQSKSEQRKYQRNYYKLKKRDILSQHKSLKGKWVVYRASAKQRQLAFTLTKERFESLISSNCQYCGGIGGGIDRIDSNKGYTVDNCCPCCTRCNRAKSDMSCQEFIEWAIKVVKYHNPEKNNE